MLYASVLLITFTLCNNSHLSFMFILTYSGFDRFSFILILIFYESYFSKSIWRTLEPSFFFFFNQFLLNPFYHHIFSTLHHLALNYCFVGLFFFFLFSMYYHILCVYHYWSCITNIVSGFLSRVMIHVTSIPCRFTMYWSVFAKIIINTTVVVLAVKLKEGGIRKWNAIPYCRITEQRLHMMEGNASRPCHCDYSLLSQGNDAISRSRRPDWP